MKTIKLTMVIVLSTTFTFTALSQSQWHQSGNLANYFGVGTNGTGLNDWKSWGFGNFSILNTPQARIHLSDFLLGVPMDYQHGNMFRTDGSSQLNNRWMLYSGSGIGNSTEKFAVTTKTFLSTANGTLQNPDNITLQASQRDMIFNAGGDIERMRILGKDHNLSGTTPWYATARAGNVGIGTAHPLTMLQIGGEGASGAGWRNWMDIGTYYASISGYDNMYVGLKEVASDRTEAIISWGNNPSANSNNGDLLRFVFTAAPGNGLASTADGFELARMWADGQDNGRMGIGNFFSAGTQPQNTLEIMASSGSPYWGQNGGASGLRFTHLTTSTIPIQNPGNGVLSVDDNGDVIYVESDAGSGGGIGNYCGAAANPLTADYEIPLNNFNFHFSGMNGLNDNQVLIGAPCGSLSPVALKLGVVQAHSFAINTPNVISYAGAFQNLDYSTILGSTFGGVYGEAVGNNNVGDGSRNIGGVFVAENAHINTGVSGRATNGGTAYGGYFTAVDGTHTNIGVYASVDPLGSGTNYSGFFTGDLIANGTIISTSDSNLKENIGELSNALGSANQMINALNPVVYDYKSTGDFAHLKLPTSHQYGLIAQEVENVLPDLVHSVVFPAEYDTLGNVISESQTYKGLNYVGLIPVLIQGAKEQNVIIDSILQVNDKLQTQVSDLNDRLSYLENCLSEILPQLCRINQSIIEGTPTEKQARLIEEIEVVLSDQSNIILNQNVPNPFAERTTIGYTIPETIKEAEIVFYGAEGRIINSVVIEERGEGRLNVYADDLSTGIYMYTLIADGQVVATKRMMKK